MNLDCAARLRRQLHLDASRRRATPSWWIRAMPAPVRDGARRALGLALAGILVTHHHADHVGGVDALRPRLQRPRVRARAARTFPRPSCRSSKATQIEVLGLRFRVLDVPGHTAGHIAYCAGRYPVGAAAVLRRHAVLRRLRPPVRRHAGADARARWPSWPPCPATRASAARTSTRCRTCGLPRRSSRTTPGAAPTKNSACALREAGQPTLPSSIALERQINPFLRCAEPTVVAAQLKPTAPTPKTQVSVLAACANGRTDSDDHAATSRAAAGHIPCRPGRDSRRDGARVAGRRLRQSSPPRCGHRIGSHRCGAGGCRIGVCGGAGRRGSGQRGQRRQRSQCRRGARSGGRQPPAAGPPPRPRTGQRRRRPLAACRATASRCPTSTTRWSTSGSSGTRRAARLRAAHDRARRAATSSTCRGGASAASMPSELALLPFIESAFNPQAVSTRAGLGHVAVHAGHRQGLRSASQNVFRDDRRDVLASTRAALDYLQRSVRAVRRLAARAGRLQLGRGQRAARDRAQPQAGLPTDYASLQACPTRRATTCPSCRR